ncbi:MAG: ABC transporter ATP-binding protein [Bryobacteraceae bacterium]|nr:ABC transporter ATP-binding protein [Bryobacteraceae bacterium]
MSQQVHRIVLSNVGRTFTSAQGESIEALRGVNLEIEDRFSHDGKDIGEFHVLLGPSGCGKSTVLRMVAGLDFPTTGEVTVNGAKVTGPGAGRGMVFQKYTSFEWLTVEQNIEYGMKLKGVAEAERRKICGHLLEATGLASFAKAYPRTLSGGMQQRVAIARTLAVRPQVVLMDEPFGALDAQTRNDMQSLLLKVWEESASTIVFVTHDVAEAVYLADRIYIMSSRPGAIVDDMVVPFGRPRDPSIKTSNEFRDQEMEALTRLRRAAGGGNIRVSL